jgi:lysophospholipase L1-like esterase
MKNNRRDFLKKTAAAGLGLISIPAIADAAIMGQTEVQASKIKKDDVILFQGDSITDCGRKRDSNVCNTVDQLGSGYALFIASYLLNKYAGEQPKIYNRGISGNKVYQLRERWETETLAFKPDVLSILIGVNDYWHTLNEENRYKGTVKTYEDDLKSLIKYTMDKLPKVKLVLCEPFTVRGGAAIEDSKWYPMFDEYRKALKDIAKSSKAIFVPFQAAFDEALKLAPARYWSADGVHPDLPGRQLMAEVWLKSTGLK